MHVVVNHLLFIVVRIDAQITSATVQTIGCSLPVNELLHEAVEQPPLSI